MDLDDKWVAAELWGGSRSQAHSRSSRHGSPIGPRSALGPPPLTEDTEVRWRTTANLHRRGVANAVEIPHNFRMSVASPPWAT